MSFVTCQHRAAHAPGCRDAETRLAFATDADPSVAKLKLGAGQVTGVTAANVVDWPGGGLLAHPLWRSDLEALLNAPWHSEQLLEFCEMVMGPSVQMNAFGISGFPAARSSAEPEPEPEQKRPPTFAWHRDNFALSQYYPSVPNGGFWGGFSPGYRSPFGMNLLCYLQDMDDQTGALRVVQGSHLGMPPTPTGDDRMLPHPQETLLDLKAGDLVCIHSDMIHSGTPNRSEEIRMYTSTYLCQLGLPHRDDFDAPVVQEYLRDARERNDPRLLRFFGEGREAWQASQEDAWAQTRREEAAQRQAKR